MATTAVVSFAEAPVPAHVAAFMADNGNIGPKQTINALSIKGKVFRMNINGEETALTKLDPETGESVPKSMIKVVILDQNRARSRSYYEGGFDPDKPAAPVCWSSDGKVPDATVPEKQSAVCQTCPRAVKGGKITESGKATTECSMNKRLVVVPAASVGEFPAMLLRLAVTSIWDKDNAENEAKGYFAYDQYLDFLRLRGVAHTAMVVTNVKFDIRKEYPKLVFKADRWLTAEEVAVAATRVGPTADPLKAAEIAALVNAPEAFGDQAAAPAPAPAAAAPAPAPARAAKTAPAPAPVVAPAPAPVVEAEDDDPVPAAAVAADPDDDDGGFNAALPPANAAKAAAAPKSAAPKVPKPAAAAPVNAAPAAPAGNAKGLANLLSQWEKDEG